MGRGSRVAIIGAGFGGLAAAIELKKAGIDDLVVLERGADVGGVWRDNTYPGAACDVPSPFYSLSYEPNPDWPRRFAQQPDILDYLQRTAEKYDLLRHIQFDTEVTAADFDELTGQWTVHTSRGEPWTVDFLVSAVGQLSRPAWPAIEGRDSFEGEMFHSAEWNHGLDLTGKRVAVIGTGASAIQFVPEIQPSVESLTVFQRTAPFLFPRPDTEFGPAHRGLFRRVPAILQAERAASWALTETFATAFLYSKTMSKGLEMVCRTHLRRQVKDPVLREKLWPNYPVGCKRVLFSSTYFPALTQPNVEVVTTGIAEITSSGVRTTAGEDFDVDVIIYGTGFTANDFLVPLKVRGINGVDLREQWADGARAYLGVTVPDFPNLFLMYGPNTSVGSGSIVYMLEAQAHYIRQAVEHGTRVRHPIAVRHEVADAWDAALQSRLARSVWTMCSSWYRDASGRISTLWPGTGPEYRLRTANFDSSDYEGLT